MVRRFMLLSTVARVLVAGVDMPSWAREFLLGDDARTSLWVGDEKGAVVA